MADNTKGTHSVPRGPMTVKAAIAIAEEGLPVISREFGATLSPEITPEEALRLLENLWFAEQRVIVRVRFKSGDTWNQLQTPFYARTRKAVLKAMRAKVDSQQYQRILRRLHNHAWVCRKWPEPLRHDRKPWTFFVENDPDTPDKTPKPEPRIVLHITRRYVVGGKEFIECSGKNDREYLACEMPPEMKEEV